MNTKRYLGSRVEGVLPQSLEVRDEDVTVDILRHLISEGYDGEDLIAQYQAMKKK